MSGNIIMKCILLDTQLTALFYFTYNAGLNSRRTTVFLVFKDFNHLLNYIFIIFQILINK